MRNGIHLRSVWELLVRRGGWAAANADRRRRLPAKGRIEVIIAEGVITASMCIRVIPLFFAGWIRSILPAWRSLPILLNNPVNRRALRGLKPRSRRHIVPRCSRSDLRSLNCSIRRLTAATPGSGPAPDCNRRRTIRGTAAPAARLRRIAREPPRAARTMRRQNGMRLSPLPTPAKRVTGREKGKSLPSRAK